MALDVERERSREAEGNPGANVGRSRSLHRAEIAVIANPVAGIGDATPEDVARHVAAKSRRWHERRSIGKRPGGEAARLALRRPPRDVGALLNPRVPFKRGP